MKLIYKIIRIAHLPDGQVMEKTLAKYKSGKIKDIKQRAHDRYCEEIEKLQNCYFPPSRFDYDSSEGVGYAVNLQVLWDLNTGEGGHQKNYIFRTTYRTSEQYRQAMTEKEDELIKELSDPQYPEDRFWIDGNSDISFLEWDGLDYLYEVNLVTIIGPDQLLKETLFRIGHRNLAEARKIALSLFLKEVEKFSPLNPDCDKGDRPIYLLNLDLLDYMNNPLLVESEPPLEIILENQNEERRIFHQRNLLYNSSDATPSPVNEIEDLWLADQLTGYDYKVMSPYKKYDLVRYVYNLRLIVKGGGKNTVEHIEEFTHHDLATAQQMALKSYREKVQDLHGKYSPDILDAADDNVTGYNYYLELSQVRGDLEIITEASFSYNGTEITQKDEEKKIFENLRRENPSSTFVNNRQKKEREENVNNSLMPNLFEDKEGDEGDHLP